MFKLEEAGFPSRYLDCYESALMCILKYLGLSEETPLAGTQAYFVLRLTEERLSVSPRFNSVSDEWKRVHGLEVESLSVAGKADLRKKIIDRLHSGIPVCLPVDIYHLPYTSHYHRLHQYHFINIFGYDSECYYVVCPYYRFRDWLDMDVVNASFLSPTIDYKHLMFVPELKLRDLSPERVYKLAQESCQYMLGLTVPETLSGANPKYLGLAGVRTFFDSLQELSVKQNEGQLPGILGLSAEIMSIGYSRYWFHKLVVQTCQERLLSTKAVTDLPERFAAVAQAWRVVGMRFGAGVHANNRDMMKQATLRLGHIYSQEEHLFSSLLGALPDYEEGKL